MKRQRKPLPRMSKNRTRERVLYEKRKKVFLTGNTRCFACGHRIRYQDRELHHLRGRAGTLFLDERFWRMACDECHELIHQHPAWAIKNQLLAHAGEWNVPVPPEGLTAEEQSTNHAWITGVTSGE